jgi:hypothetical protein
MRQIALALLLCGCGDDRNGPQDALVLEAGTDASGDLFGEACVPPPPPEIGICHMGEGACHDETAGPACRPFCDLGGQPQCTARKGVEAGIEGGACVCVPP